MTSFATRVALLTTLACASAIPAAADQSVTLAQRQRQRKGRGQDQELADVAADPLASVGASSSCIGERPQLSTALPQETPAARISPYDVTRQQRENVRAMWVRAVQGADVSGLESAMQALPHVRGGKTKLLEFPVEFETVHRFAVKGTAAGTERSFYERRIGTALQQAALAGHSDAVDYLIGQGASLMPAASQQLGTIATVLHDAMVGGDRDCIRAVLRAAHHQGVLAQLLTTRDSLGRTPLDLWMWVERPYSREIVNPLGEFLQMMRGLDPALANRLATQLARPANAPREGAEAASDQIIHAREEHWNSNTHSMERESTMSRRAWDSSLEVQQWFDAVARGDIPGLKACLEALPEKGASPHGGLVLNRDTLLNYHSSFMFGHSALTQALRAGDLAMVQFLIEQGANVAEMYHLPLFIQDGKASVGVRTTLLHEAARTGNPEMVETIARAMVQTDPALLQYCMTQQEGMAGDNPLHIAAKRGDAAVIDMLIANWQSTTLDLTSLLLKTNRAGHVAQALAQAHGHAALGERLHEYYMAEEARARLIVLAMMGTMALTTGALLLTLILNARLPPPPGPAAALPLPPPPLPPGPGLLPRSATASAA